VDDILIADRCIGDGVVHYGGFWSESSPTVFQPRLRNLDFSKATFSASPQSRRAGRDGSRERESIKKSANQGRAAFGVEHEYGVPLKTLLGVLDEDLASAWKNNTSLWSEPGTPILSKTY
jgi:hypothetical protein